MPWDMSYDDYPVTGNRPGHSTDDLYTFGDANTMYSDMMEDQREEWHTTPSGDTCLWCAGSDTEPDDDDDAEALLCRGHLAEYLGESLDSLDRAEQQAYADMRDAGMYDD